MLLAFRAVLVLYLVGLVIYTGLVIAEHGWSLLAVFVGDMAEINWPGQFNLDFLGFLALSAIWTAWRHQFSAGGLALSVLAFLGGMLFLGIYLLTLSVLVQGDMKRLLMGPSRA